ncbi:hypothetical protein C4D60_Mb10t10450 [Musa balbisiana]|uniref:Uncharacterized protein n=1 Tax=Musa balbisiana TaxID=52838 RepID=A0A4S8IW23_MUSBA|nr:hypothetical protein C4D60_Mb10t10450 [Musa balbisiana]
MFSPSSSASESSKTIDSAKQILGLEFGKVEGESISKYLGTRELGAIWGKKSSSEQRLEAADRAVEALTVAVGFPLLEADVIPVECFPCETNLSHVSNLQFLIWISVASLLLLYRKFAGYPFRD